MKKKWKNMLRGSAYLSTLVLGIVCALVLLSNVQEPIVKQVVQEDREWKVVAGPSPVNYAAGGVTGVVYICVREHWANGSYDDNMTDITDPYAYHGSQYNTSLGGNVPASTAFDIVITVRLSMADIFNGTDPQMAAGSAVDGTDWARMNLTCPHTTPAIGALTAASGRRNVTDQVLNGGNDMFYNFYWNNSGSGYTIGNGVNANVTAFTLEIYS